MATETVSRAIVEAVSEARGVPAHELEAQLAEHVDPDALQQLSAHNGGNWRLSFEFSGHDVTVTSDGRVAVDESPTLVEA